MPDQPNAAPPPATAAPGPGPGSDDRLDPALIRLSVTVMLGAIMVILDTTIVSVAIHALGNEFHTSLSTISWVSTGYLLALAVVIPLAGWSVERFGATRMWNISLALFVAGSALCGVAWSAEALIAFRILQGLGGGMIMPICMTVLAQAAGPRRMGRVMSIIGVPTLIAPVLGPVVGGLIVDHLSWRWIFYVNVPIGVLALFLSWRVLPRDDRGSAHHRLDLPGLALISPGLAALVYGLSEAGNGGGFGAAKVEVSIGLGLALLAGFVGYALRRDGALLDLRLFRDRTFSMAGLTTFAIGAMLFGAMFLLPLYYQIARGQSASDAGLLMAPQGLGAMIAMTIAGRVVDRRGARSVVPLGMALALLGTLPFTQVDAHTNEALLALSLFVRGLGFGAAMMPAMTAAYATLEPAAVPRATTTLNILQRVGGSLATALVAVELQHAIASRLPGVGGGEGALAESAGVQLPGSVADKVAEAFGTTYWWIIALTAVGFVASLFLPGRPADPAADGPANRQPQIPRPEPAGVE
ncbi:drug resistance transporter, EmrB/QacA subfamily [Frankia torreyi]|uniref:Drug resistance transporter, EmrB/QacA subfamily n=2 Tax=Frankia TaxID=1854 RepID=A0A0D8BA28_9ACTN|nr:MULTISPECIES: MDR family MFS transporter [Frankia]KJE21143.1 drug resistance transporter, EmrB/QacA subfamily [Frankia torreyi]KQC36603.1 multidrug MFS transporter [Frankia sp. ACN1ag]KQM03188.1 drug resistance transporter, EmrB/QacA subfamily [Frankia sp. CpI1-P]